VSRHFSDATKGTYDFSSPNPNHNGNPPVRLAITIQAFCSHSMDSQLSFSSLNEPMTDADTAAMQAETIGSSSMDVSALQFSPSSQVTVPTSNPLLLMLSPSALTRRSPSAWSYPPMPPMPLPSLLQNPSQSFPRRCNHRQHLYASIRLLVCYVSALVNTGTRGIQRPSLDGWKRRGPENGVGYKSTCVFFESATCS